MTRPLFWKRLATPRPLAGGAVLALALGAVGAFAAIDHAFLHRGWPLLAGLIFGVALQRGEISFVRAWRDLLILRDGEQLLGFAAAIAVAGTLTLAGIALSGGEPPHGARIGPISWLLAVSAFAFGLGSVIARGSLMVHLRRLGEGSLIALPALAATFVGFCLAMATWGWSWRVAIGGAPEIWLPASLGVWPTAALQLAAIAAFVAVLWRFRPKPRARSRFLIDPWPALAAGVIVGLLIAASYAAGEPFGLASEAAATARRWMTAFGLAPHEMPGLDGGVGGLVVPLRPMAFSGHVVIVTGVIGGSAAAALASGRFSIAGMTLREACEMAIGGLLIGWGGMTGLGTITGAGLSGVAVGALSGWVFLAFASLGIIAGLKLDRRDAIVHPQPEPAETV